MTCEDLTLCENQAGVTGCHPGAATTGCQQGRQYLFNRFLLGSPSVSAPAEAEAGEVCSDPGQEANGRILQVRKPKAQEPGRDCPQALAWPATFAATRVNHVALRHL